MVMMVMMRMTCQEDNVEDDDVEYDSDEDGNGND